MAEKQYAVVQHSAFGYKQDTTFERAVESRAVTEAQARSVTQAGGVVYPSYEAAEDACEMFNWPPDVLGLTPQVRGSFGTLLIDSLAIYIPIREIVG